MVIEVQFDDSSRDLGKAHGSMGNILHFFLQELLVYPTRRTNKTPLDRFQYPQGYFLCLDPCVVNQPTHASRTKLLTIPAFYLS
jgi:hypothetical protein